MTAPRDPRRLAIVIAIVVLAGAIAFGLWHVVVGGMLAGNLRAAGFGLILAVGAGGLVRALLAVDRRARRG